MSGRRVLVVEDDSLERKALEKLFSLCFGGVFSVVTACDGASAIERLCRFSFSLVLLDINLPDMSGIDILFQIERDYPDTKVIMATAYSDYAHLRDSLRGKAFDYLVKPYSMDTFREAVGRYLESGGEGKENLYGNRKAVEEIRLYLEEHYRENITLQSLAGLVHKDKSYIGRIFRREYGMSIFAYLLQIRMKKARELLDKGMNVAETAEAVGYEDPAYFGKCFKQVVGVPPQKYTAGR